MTVQLAHTASGREIWAERYDRDLEEIFEVQDEVVRTIVVRLEAGLGKSIADIAGGRSKPTLAAYECVRMANKYVAIHDAAQAMPYIERAIELDPTYAAAYDCLSGFHYVEHLATGSKESLEKMIAAARKSIALDNSDSSGHAHLGMALTLKKEYDAARTHIDRAIILNPANTSAVAYRAEWFIHVGNASTALAEMDRLLQRDPISPPWHLEIRAMALMMLKRYHEAIDSFSWPVVQLWYVHAYLALCHARLGQLDKARGKIGELLQLMPEMTIDRCSLPDEFFSQEDRDFITEGLRLAGLPE